MRGDRILPVAFLLAGFAAGFCLLAASAAGARRAQDAPGKSEPSKQDKPQAPEQVTIHVEVTAGEKNKPVENASVYVRYYETHKFKSDKLIELDVKTSVAGKARVPLVPKGRILIQVVAEGWKPYGRWFDLTEDGQVFKIHLDPPHHWY